MVIDTSVLIAILRDEAESKDFQAAIISAPTRSMSAVSLLEAGMVAIGRRGPLAAADLDRLIVELDVSIVAFDHHQARLAKDAFLRFGKGRHPAGLNFGDCASYALAMAEGEPLLFKGTDFGVTDVIVAVRDV